LFLRVTFAIVCHVLATQPHLPVRLSFGQSLGHSTPILPQIHYIRRFVSRQKTAILCKLDRVTCVLEKESLRQIKKSKKKTAQLGSWMGYRVFKT
jgi:hypothetical protein